MPFYAKGSVTTPNHYVYAMDVLTAIGASVSIKDENTLEIMIYKDDQDLYSQLKSHEKTLIKETPNTVFVYTEFTPDKELYTNVISVTKTEVVQIEHVAERYTAATLNNYFGVHIPQMYAITNPDDIQHILELETDWEVNFSPEMIQEVLNYMQLHFGNFDEVYDSDIFDMTNVDGVTITDGLQQGMTQYKHKAFVLAYIDNPEKNPEPEYITGDKEYAIECYHNDEELVILSKDEFLYNQIAKSFAEHEKVLDVNNEDISDYLRNFTSVLFVTADNIDSVADANVIVETENDTIYACKVTL